MNRIRIVFLGFLSLAVLTGAQNLSCYQCIRNSSEECGSDNLLPCPSVADRCVTHISKRVDNGYLIKRECGLGPCGFEDDMVNRGLGMDGCDRSKDDYFCVFCCRTDGCNRNSSPNDLPSFHFLPTLIISTVHLSINNYF